MIKIKYVDESEQWKLSGMCSKCRRQRYCGSVCKAARTSNRSEIQQLVADHMFGKFLNVVKENYHYNKEMNVYDRPD